MLCNFKELVTLLTSRDINFAEIDQVQVIYYTYLFTLLFARKVRFENHYKEVLI